MPCAGNAAQTCGDANRVSLYYDSTVTGPINPPRTVNGSSGFPGCYTEAGGIGGSARTLVGALFCKL